MSSQLSLLITEIVQSGGCNYTARALLLNVTICLWVVGGGLKNVPRITKMASIHVVISWAETPFTMNVKKHNPGLELA
jgi:hypothetical protein